MMMMMMMMMMNSLLELQQSNYVCKIPVQISIMFDPIV